MNPIRLAARLKHHDEDALAELITCYTPLVSTIASQIACGQLSRADIEEIVSDVFVTVWKNAAAIRPDTIKGYICCIAKSRTKDRLRQIHFRQTADLEEADQADDFFLDELYERKEIHQTLREEIRKLSEPDREILIRHYYYYQTVSAIAEALQMNAETVKSKLRRTRNKLKKALKDRGYYYDADK